MDTEKLKFETLGEKERKLLLSALEIPMNNMQCFYCAEKIDYRTCGIMPPLSRGEIGRITCSSPLCICEYLDDYAKTKFILKKITIRYIDEDNFKCIDNFYSKEDFKKSRLYKWIIK